MSHLVYEVPAQINWLISVSRVLGAFFLLFFGHRVTNTIDFIFNKFILKCMHLQSGLGHMISSCHSEWPGTQIVANKCARIIEELKSGRISEDRAWFLINEVFILVVLDNMSDTEVIVIVSLFILFLIILLFFLVGFFFFLCFLTLLIGCFYLFLSILENKRRTRMTNLNDERSGEKYSSSYY